MASKYDRFVNVMVAQVQAAQLWVVVDITECRSVVQKRGPSHLRRLKRRTGSDLIAPRRRNSAHLHRPWRATSAQSWALQDLLFCARHCDEPAQETLARFSVQAMESKIHRILLIEQDHS
jgi:hypothetical protein